MFFILGCYLKFQSPTRSPTQNEVNDEPKAYIDFTETSTNVTTTVGHTSYLHCKVRQLGDKAVSWIRSKDLHILSTGVFTYTSDARFQVLHPQVSKCLHS